MRNLVSSTDFELEVLIKNTVPALSDQKRRVRQVGRVHLTDPDQSDAKVANY